MQRINNFHSRAQQPRPSDSTSPSKEYGHWWTRCLARDGMKIPSIGLGTIPNHQKIVIKKLAVLRFSWSTCRALQVGFKTMRQNRQVRNHALSVTFECIACLTICAYLHPLLSASLCFCGSLELLVIKSGRSLSASAHSFLILVRAACHVDVQLQAAVHTSAGACALARWFLQECRIIGNPVCCDSTTRHARRPC